MSNQKTDTDTGAQPLAVPPPPTGSAFFIMGAHYFNYGRCSGVIHVADIYRYGGYTFEFHRYCGPVLCRKDMEPAARQPGLRSKFWPVLSEWQKLTNEEKEATRICG